MQSSEEKIFDYYAFGSPMPGRQFNSSSYRYGFNGKRKDDEISGNGNHLDFGDRGYDPRRGQWWSVDSKARDYPSISPYAFALNSPISLRDIDGNIVVDANGNPVTVSVEKGKDGNYTASFDFQAGTSDEVKNKFNQNAGVVINLMVQTKIGREITEKMVSASHKISIDLSEETLYSDGKGNYSTTPKEGYKNVTAGGTVSKPDGKGGVKSSKITVYKGSIKKLVKLPQYSKYTVNDFIGKNGTHEGTHATDKNSNQVTAPKEANLEEKPTENGQKHLDEIDSKKSNPK